MDNLGAIGGPLLALALVALVGVRSAIVLSVVPGLLAAEAIVIAIRFAPKLGVREKQPLRVQVRPVLRGGLGRLFIGVGAFEFGNAAATLLILRATDLLEPGRGHDAAVEVAPLLYAGYNLAATVASIPGGHVADRHGNVRVLAVGVAAFLVAYLGFGMVGSTIVGLALLFAAAGIGIGLVETAEHAAVPSLAPNEIRGSAFGLLAATQSFGNLAASAIAGALWTLASRRLAFLYLAAWMLVSLVALTLRRPQSRRLRWRASLRPDLTGEAEHEVERCWRPRPVRGDEIGSAASKDVPQCERDDDGVVEVARDRDEVGDEVERHEQVGDQGGEDKLLPSGNARIGEQPLEEDDAVGHKRSRGARPLPAAGDDENGDEDRVQRSGDQRGDGDGLPESQFEGDCSAPEPGSSLQRINGR
jgi:Major Facilitator Superfamily